MANNGRRVILACGVGNYGAAAEVEDSPEAGSAGVAGYGEDPAV